jgi:hypothetical protein
LKSFVHTVDCWRLWIAWLILSLLNSWWRLRHMLWRRTWLWLLRQLSLRLLLTLGERGKTWIAWDRRIGHDATEEVIGTVADRGRGWPMK